MKYLLILVLLCGCVNCQKEDIKGTECVQCTFIYGVSVSCNWDKQK